MKLDESQKRTVAQWIQDGLKLAEIQKRLGTEFHIQLTYMEVRFLVDDLKLTPLDPVKVEPLVSPPSAPPQPPKSETAAPLPGTTTPAANPAATSNVSVSVDSVTRPGAMVSGSVTFSDGESAAWYLDQMGRLGVVAKTQGYKPSQADVQAFQQALEAEFSKLGF